MSHFFENWVAQIFVTEELTLPIPLTTGPKTPIDRAYEVLDSISDGLLTKKNSLPIIANSEITSIIVRQFQPLKIGDIVTLNPISETGYDFCFCYLFIPKPVGYCKVLAESDDDGDLKIECIATGKVFTSGRQFWIKVQSIEMGSDHSEN